MKYFVGVVGVVLAILLVVIVVLNRGDDKPAATIVPATKLVDYANKNSSVSFTTYGRLVGDQERRAIRVTITPTERRLEVLSGYGKTVESVQTFENTQEAYANFLSALASFGYTKEKKTSTTDRRGVCPTGYRYDYELFDGGETKQDLWSSGCSKDGTFAGTASTIKQLFKMQIPEYDKKVRPVEL